MPTGAANDVVGRPPMLPSTMKRADDKHGRYDQRVGVRHHDPGEIPWIQGFLGNRVGTRDSSPARTATAAGSRIGRQPGARKHAVERADATIGEEDRTVEDEDLRARVAVVALTFET